MKWVLLGWWTWRCYSCWDHWETLSAFSDPGFPLLASCILWPSYQILRSSKPTHSQACHFLFWVYRCLPTFLWVTLEAWWSDPYKISTKKQVGGNNRPSSPIDPHSCRPTVRRWVSCPFFRWHSWRFWESGPIVSTCTRCSACQGLTSFLRCFGRCCLGSFDRALVARRLFWGALKRRWLFNKFINGFA